MQRGPDVSKTCLCYFFSLAKHFKVTTRTSVRILTLDYTQKPD